MCPVIENQNCMEHPWSPPKEASEAIGLKLDQTPFPHPPIQSASVSDYQCGMREKQWAARGPRALKGVLGGWPAHPFPMRPVRPFLCDIDVPGGVWTRNARGNSQMEMRGGMDAKWDGTDGIGVRCSRYGAMASAV